MFFVVISKVTYVGMGLANLLCYVIPHEVQWHFQNGFMNSIIQVVKVTGLTLSGR